MRKPIPYGKQYLTKQDIRAVVSTLKSEFLTQGPKIAEFEKAFAKYIGVEYAVAVANGTGALHLCALALNVQPGQKVITTPITFAASANCIKYCGGDVVFADIDTDSYLIDIEAVKKILSASPKGTYAGIVVVDFAGRAVNLELFKQLANDYDLWLIEDACHAPGGYFNDNQKHKQLCGNGSFADLAIFSFHPVKHIATGEGGMITTNDKNLYETLLQLRTHGITRDQKSFLNDLNWTIGNAVNIPSDYPGWYMEMQQLGYNYRLTDFQSALGISQLKRAGKGLKRRREIAKEYAKAFQNEQWLKGQSGYLKEHAYHLYIIEVDDRLGLYNHLKTKNIFPQVHYIPTHLMPYYIQQGYKLGDFPNAENYYSRCLSLPMYPTLSKDEQKYVINSIKGFYK
ncbi:MAG TPA: UDP-4-amino-4,6-dideoxy-N-acetyl-beta-L-altrosamine transaminase [Chitinophagaceae bacterium]|nr:UDP-4-amino-4,6-dideoxy-N-acetyl-beta-L-altrosamine transaminase [Chitinophagaceae bacterium]